MRKTKWVVIVIIFLMGVTAIWNLLESKKIVFHTSSQYIVLMDRSNHRIVASKNGGDKLYPASMTKIMTTLIALEEIKDDQKKVQMSDEIVDKVKKQGASAAGFRSGDIVTIRDLLYGMMLPSGAECCYRIVKYLDGSQQSFVDRMNRKAAQLGMKDTHFSNTTGLHQKYHYTTAQDMAVLLDYALKNKRFRKIFTSMTYQTSSSGKILYSTLYPNQDELKLDNGTFLGGKTGYTREAGLCLASLAKINGKEYILITAGAQGNHQTKPYHILDAVRIFQKL